MIKEIGIEQEDGLIKYYGITLADDMVGKGLTKTGDGAIFLNLDVELNSQGDIMSGLTFSGDKLSLLRSALANGLVGSGLYVASGRLCLSGGVDVNALCGTGLRVYDDKLCMDSGIAGSGLRVYDDKLCMDSGIAGSGLRYIEGASHISVLINTDSGLGFEVGAPNAPILIKIARHSSGLRLFFNSQGELDVTQD